MYSQSDNVATPILQQHSQVTQSRRGGIVSVTYEDKVDMLQKIAFEVVQKHVNGR